MKRGMRVSLGILAMFLSAGVEVHAQHYVQDNYRWRNDDGGEAAPSAGASWKAAANTPITGVRRLENLRVRFSVKETAGTAGMFGVGVTLFYATDAGGPWTRVGDPLASGELPTVVATAPTTWYANNEPTTAQLGGPGTFEPGKCFESQEGGFGVVVSPFASRYCNIEHCIQISPAAPRNTTYYFRLGVVGPQTSISEWTVLAQLTVENADYTAKPQILSSLAPQNIAGGMEWSYTIVARGLYPLQYAADGLPQGIALSSNVLSGRPLQYGAFPVTLTVTDANGSSNAVLTLNVSAPASEVIVDDADDAHTTKSGTWAASTVTAGAWNGGCVYVSRFPTNENAATFFRWIPDVPMTGQYQVYGQWTSTERRGRHIPYRITHASGTTDEIFVNQRDPALAGQWNLLGTYTFNLGTNGYVELSGNDGEACADAIKLERVQ